MDIELRSRSLFSHEFDGTPIPQGRMASHTIVEDFNVFEDRRPSLRSGSMPLEIHLLGFEAMKKRCGHRIGVAIARTTHALAHHHHRECRSVIVDKGILQVGRWEKMPTAFFRISRSCLTRSNCRGNCRISSSSAGKRPGFTYFI